AALTASVAARGGPAITPLETEAVPGAGSAPRRTIPSWGVTLDGDHLGALRTHRPPVIARARDGATVLDLRTVDPADDAVLSDVLCSLRSPATQADGGRSSAGAPPRAGEES
ncbi:MAG: hypothetical protein H0U21_14340, partial [Acidimicrobiia bacterium]|nr:hypothetical protein [Acidimicrobiia bacterium]